MLLSPQIPGFLDNKNMATFFCFILSGAVMMGIPPAHSFVQLVIASPVFVSLDFLCVTQSLGSSSAHLGLSILHYIATRGFWIPIAGFLCTFCTSAAFISSQNSMAAAELKSGLSTATPPQASLDQSLLPFESFGFNHPQWSRVLLLGIRHRVGLISENTYGSLILCVVALPVVIYHAALGLAARFFPRFESYLQRISGDQLILALLSAFIIGRDSRNLDISQLLHSLNEARNNIFPMIGSSQRPTATDLIDSVRRQVAESGEVAGDDEAGDDDVTALEVLGEGSYGKVFKGTWRGTEVAIKSMALPSESSSSERNERLAIMEAAISSALSHPHIVQLYTYSLRPSTTTRIRSSTDAETGSHSSQSERGRGVEMRLILEHMDLGSLTDALSRGIFSEPSSGVNYKALLEAAADVARAMIHLHSLNILHNDIKARNVLLKSNDKGVTVKLSDFGLAMKIDRTQEIKSICGTLTHLAPETIRDSIKSKATDVYAFGILLHEIICPGELYFGTNRSFLRHAVLLGKRPEFPDWVPTGYVHLAWSCWDGDPNARPTFKEVLKILIELIAKEDGAGWLRKVSNIDPALTKMPSIDKKDQPESKVKAEEKKESALKACSGTFDFHGSGLFVGSMIEEAPKEGEGKAQSSTTTTLQPQASAHDDALERLLANQDILTKSIGETLR